MKESARAAMSYVRSRAQLLGLDKEFYQLIDLHIHVPEGAIPKDGPSAGIAITTSIISALTRVEVKKDIAMTGEITLRGRVLPIGGLKEKIFAAHRGLISTVIIPRENEKDLKDIPEKILKDLKIVMVDHMDEVIRLALVTDSAEAFAGKAVDGKQFFRETPVPEDIPPQLHQ
jgi:ATP-dependent Lon protease